SQAKPGLVGQIFAALFKKGTGPSMRQIDSNYFVAGQISPDHLAQLKEAGFSAVCCMRPDGEGFGQTPFAEIEAAAKALGMKAYYLPVSGGSMPMQHASKLKAVLREEKGKILGYCASGGRSTMLYQLARQAAA
ncbi:MAG TPA: sulfur transferase domain-containing protein, partial [Ensifer sp.]|nr:sulfur transferase domain-containing protein [Ensifer sp.]